MKNKIIICILTFALLLSLCGCRLANPEQGGEETARDRLIGCFITTEHLDLFDFEAYFNDNAHKLVAGGNVTLDGDTREYQGRIYAEFYEETITGENGESHTTGGYRFADLEGIACFAPKITEADGSSYITFMTDNCLDKLHNGVKSTDEETYYTEMSATVYVPIDGESELVGDEDTFYMNPVYQAADGSVYLTAGNGFRSNSTYPGELMTTTLREDYKTTINGEEITGGGKVAISIETAYIPEALRIIEMDGSGNVLKVSELEPTDLPESYIPQRGTAYIVCEAISVDSEGQYHTERSFIEPDGEDKDIFVLVPSENGWLVNNYCQVLWEE